MSRVMKEQDDQLQRQLQTLSPSGSLRSGVTPSSSYDSKTPDGDARDLLFNFSDKHRSLQLQLQPLIRVRGDLEKYIGSATLEPDQVRTTAHTVFPSSDPGSSRPTPRHTEFCVSAIGSWKTRLLEKEGSKPFTKDSIHDLHDTTKILYHFGPAIKELWTDDVVQQVLKGTKAQLEHSPGL